MIRKIDALIVSSFERCLGTLEIVGSNPISATHSKMDWLIEWVALIGAFGSF